MRDPIQEWIDQTKSHIDRCNILLTRIKTIITLMEKTHNDAPSRHQGHTQSYRPTRENESAAGRGPGHHDRPAKPLQRADDQLHH